MVTDDADKFDRDRLVQAMVGRTLSSELYGETGSRVARPYGEKVLSIENLSMGNAVRNTSFSVYAGQVTGLFGLVGAGRTETMKIVSGVLKRDFLHGGNIRMKGRSVRYRTPRSAVKDGTVYVTEDRKPEGFFETMSIAENIQIGKLETRNNPVSIVSMSEAQEFAKQWSGCLAVRAIDTDAKVIELSGGNQQKVVISKSMVQKPLIAIFDGPTRGVDVGAIVKIHNFINELAESGIAMPAS